MDDSGLHFKKMVATMFSDLNKQPVCLQLEIVNTLECFIDDWKVRNQLTRNVSDKQWKFDMDFQQPLNSGVASDIKVESLSDVQEMQGLHCDKIQVKKGNNYNKEEEEEEEESDVAEEEEENDTGLLLGEFLCENEAKSTDQHLSNTSKMVDFLVFCEDNERQSVPPSSAAPIPCISDPSHHADDKIEHDGALQKDLGNHILEPNYEKLLCPDPKARSPDGYSNNEDHCCNETLSAVSVSFLKESEQPRSEKVRQQDKEGKQNMRGKRKMSQAGRQVKQSRQQLTICEICGACVKIIKVHMMQHGERPHKCPYCSYTSHQRGTLDVHIRRLHTNDRPHLCDICGKGFVKSSLLKEHISVKHNQISRERSFICKECNFSTFTRTLLENHMTNRHKPAGRHVYKCEQCDAQVYSTHSLKEHVSLCHTNERPFPCDMCDFAAKSEKRLKNHMIYHREKAFKCDTCSKMFFTRPQLTRHQLVHTRTTDFSCLYCNYQCSLRENLRKHCQAIHKVTYPAKKRLNYRREFPKPKQPKEMQHLEETVDHHVALPTRLEMINCSA